MIFRLFLVSIWLISLVSHSFSQELRQTVRGKIIDAATEQPLGGASVMITNLPSPMGCIADSSGFFKINDVPVGRISLKVSFTGYAPVELQNVDLTSAKQLNLTIRLEENYVTTDVVEIADQENEFKSRDETIINSVVRLNPEETGKYAGAKFDPARMVQNFAGVTSPSDTRNDIIVRGGSPLGVLWRIEDIDIPNPNHFGTQGATGGPISMVNNNLLATSDFLTGGFPAYYGNKISAVFDLKYRNGNDEKHEFIGQFGINGFELLSEGPISKAKKSSYLASLRYANLGLMMRMGINLGIVAIPQFGDFSFKLYFPQKNGDILSVIGLSGMSHSSVDSQEDTTSFGNGRDIITGTKLAVVGFTYQHFYNEKSYGKWILSACNNLYTTTVDSVSQTGEQTKTRWYSNDSYEGQFALRYIHTYKFSSRSFFKAGVTLNLLRFQLNERRYTTSFFFPTVPYQQDTNGWGFLTQTFVHWNYKLHPKCTLHSGIYSQYLSVSRDYSIEPRIGLSWKQSKQFQFTSSVGLFTMAQPLVVYSLKPALPDTNIFNQDLRFTSSIHYVVSQEWYPGKSWQFKAEAYYQTIFDAPISPFTYDKGFVLPGGIRTPPQIPGRFGAYSALNLGTDFGGVFTQYHLESTGKGRNYGVEFSVKKNLNKHYYLIANTSLFRSEYLPKDGIWRNTAFDNRYVVNFLGGYEHSFNQTHSIDVNIKYVRVGGRPYTPIDLTNSQLTGEEIPDYTQYLAQRHPDYERFDIRLNYKVNLKLVSISSFISIENVFARKNVQMQYYDVENKRIKTQYQLGFFPVGGFRIEF